MTVKRSAKKQAAESKRRSPKATSQKVGWSEGGKVFYTVTPKVSTGDYENVAISVGLSLPCTPDDYGEKFKEARKWVRETLEAELDAVKKSMSR